MLLGKDDVFDGFGIYASSSAIIIPLAYILMTNCYKKTNVLYSIIFMGIIAALIKLSTALIVGFRDIVYKPHFSF